MWDSTDFSRTRFLAFAEDCRAAGICLPSATIEQREVEMASRRPGTRRMWCGHDTDAYVYWFSDEDPGALTYLAAIPDSNGFTAVVPTVGVPLAGDTCRGCVESQNDHYAQGDKYQPKTSEQKLGYLIEECGEVLAAAGKTIRGGESSYNPELPPEEQETNREWLLRELVDLRRAIQLVHEDLHGDRVDQGKVIDIVFDGPPDHEAGRFVEVEDSAGKSMKVGDWIQRPDGYWVLRLTVVVT